MPRTPLTKEERDARHRERMRIYNQKHRDLMILRSRNWVKNNPERVKLSAINRARHFFSEGEEIDYNLAVNVYHNSQKGSLIVRPDKLQELMEEHFLPYLPNDTYRWETLSEIGAHYSTATHTLTYTDEKITWEVVIPGRLGVRGQKVHRILGPEHKIVANCVASTRAGDDPNLLANYFIWLAFVSVGKASLDDKPSSKDQTNLEDQATSTNETSLGDQADSDSETDLEDQAGPSAI